MRSIAILSALCLASCASLPTGDPRAISRVGDPALDGKDYLLSDADFRSLLRAAREYVARETPWYTVRRVHVTSSTEVQLFLGGAVDFGEPFMLYAYRHNGAWRITGGGEIIHVTDFRSNQALQPTADRQENLHIITRALKFATKLAPISGG